MSGQPGNPGTDGTASEFPAKGAGNPWQSRLSPAGYFSMAPVVAFTNAA